MREGGFLSGMEEGFFHGVYDLQANEKLTISQLLHTRT